MAPFRPEQTTQPQQQPSLPEPQAPETPREPAVNPFKSFWMGGFECSCQINGSGTRLDMISSTQHDLHAATDYQLLHGQGISTARDGVRWHLIDRAGTYDFTSLTPLLKAAEQQDTQVIWDLCHYGWPDDLDIFSTDFIDRFARFCSAVAHHIADNSQAAPLYIPINEISFFSWAAAEVGYFHPFAQGRGMELKRQLVRAALAGTDAIRAADPRARILTAEPVINVVTPPGRLGCTAAARVHESQFEAWDMLAGRSEPELGGAEHYLDVLGVNYYSDNQWEEPGGKRLRWNSEPADERWVPFHRMLLAVWERYQRPLFVAETSHYGIHRAPWLNYITAEVIQARSLGVPVLGICLYPIINRHGWDDPLHWHDSGLWDLLLDATGKAQHVLNTRYATELQEAQARINRAVG